MTLLEFVFLVIPNHFVSENTHGSDLPPILPGDTGAGKWYAFLGGCD